MSGVSTVWDVLIKVFKSPYVQNKKEILGYAEMSSSSASMKSYDSTMGSTNNDENLLELNIENDDIRGKNQNRENGTYNNFHVKHDKKLIIAKGSKGKWEQLLLRF